MRFFHFILIMGLFFSFANNAIATSSARHASNHTSTSRHAKPKHRVVKKRSSHVSRVSASRRHKRSEEFSGVQVPGSIEGKRQLEYVLSRIIASTETGSENIALYVKSLKSGETLYVRNIYQPMIPASIMKLLTAEAALLYLGPNYRFSTQLLTDAKRVSNGVLQGNLYIVLNGDPSLTYSDLVELMVNLQSQGITAISGNVYIDNTAYDQRFYGPGWGGKDKNYCYGAPISASIINHNCLPLSVQPSSIAGARAKNIILPERNYPGIHNDVVTDIPEYNRALFKNLLHKLGIDVYGTVTFGSAPSSLSLVASHNSDPLPELIREMLKKSDNVIAGALFKKLGQLYAGRPGSWENGSLAVSKILSQQADVQIKGMRLLDGSGLSVNNLATPTQFMQVLQFAYSNRKTSEYFISALPIAGVDGTLKNRMRNIARKVRAKTGTISGVVSLAGYASSYYKEPLAFVIIINGNKGLGWRYKGMEDKIATALTRYIAR